MINTNLPFIAYGLLKSDELGFSQISVFVDEVTPLKLGGFSLKVADGVAFAVRDPNRYIEAESISFTSGTEAYRQIERFEGVPFEYSRYRWDEVSINGQGCNVLIARGPLVSTEITFKWSSSEDVVFAQAMPWLHREIDSAIRGLRETMISEDKSAHYWSSYFQLQACLLVLWSVQERLEQFMFGVEKGYESMADRRKSFAAEELFQQALEIADVKRALSVRDYRTPGGSALSAERKPLACWFRLRSNITHHGKGSEREIIKVATATVDHFNALLAFFHLKAKPIAEQWNGLTMLPKSLYDSRLY